MKPMQGKGKNDPRRRRWDESVAYRLLEDCVESRWHTRASREEIAARMIPASKFVDYLIEALLLRNRKKIEDIIRVLAFLVRQPHPKWITIPDAHRDPGVPLLSNPFDLWEDGHHGKLIELHQSMAEAGGELTWEIVRENLGKYASERNLSRIAKELGIAIKAAPKGRKKGAKDSDPRRRRKK